jgi:adenylosuccinate synthase
MSAAIAVIGAGWGDEGKGLMIDAIARPGSVVVRANGGAQAGHTVQRPNGERHVFHHVGSGAWRGAATFLSRFFIHNPLLLETELAELAALGIEPEILADGQGQVTTPWDMMINQIAEEARDATRHGSCGLGINETLRRGADENLVIRVRDSGQVGRLKRLAEQVQQEWVPARLAALGLKPSPIWRQRLASSGVMDSFLESAARFSAHIKLDDGARPAAAGAQGRLLFEGAQGLLLDQDHEFFPHVTPSKTGIANPSQLAREWGVKNLCALYVTRAYATRHGAGPFPREVSGLTYPDATNIPNPWQGSLRFGSLDLDLLAKSIGEDQPCAGVPVENTLAMTCLDQVGDTVTWWQTGQRQTGNAGRLMAAAQSATGMRLTATSRGPCREGVSFLLWPGEKSVPQLVRGEACQ